MIRNATLPISFDKFFRRNGRSFMRNVSFELSPLAHCKRKTFVSPKMLTVQAGAHQQKGTRSERQKKAKRVSTSIALHIRAAARQTLAGERARLHPRHDRLLRAFTTGGCNESLNLGREETLLYMPLRSSALTKLKAAG